MVAYLPRFFITMKLLKFSVGIVSLVFFVSVGASLSLADSALITHIVFTSSAQTTDAGVASGVMTVQTQNASSMSEKISGGPQTLEFTSTSGTGEFSNANSGSCSGTFSAAPFTLTMSTGTANKNFCYRDATAGTYTLTVSAQGQSWTAAAQTTVITAPPDMTPPVIAARADITGVEATSDVGAAVVYTPPDATDNVDATAPADCTPTSGSIFTLGTTEITCTKTDAAGNSATPTTFSITVVDTVPDPFAFVDMDGVAFESEVVSTVITVSGITASVAVSVTGGHYSINNSAYTSNTGTVANGDAITVRQTSSGINGGTVNTTLTIGGVSDAFTTTTAHPPAGGGGYDARRSMTTAPLVQTSPSREETVGATRIALTPTEMKTKMKELRQEVLTLMYQLVLSFQARLDARS